jgi:hypothetical protein
MAPFRALPCPLSAGVKLDLRLPLLREIMNRVTPSVLSYLKNFLFLPPFVQLVSLLLISFCALSPDSSLVVRSLPDRIPLQLSILFSTLALAAILPL